MKVVAKYTLILVATLAVALSVLAALRVSRDRAHFEHDMALDHRVVGAVLRANIIELWRDALEQAAVKGTAHLIERTNATSGRTHFEWIAGAMSPVASQRIEGSDFVSRFPVEDAGRPLGLLVVREPLGDIDRLVHSDIVLSAVIVGSILLFGLIASLILGRWLLGRPIELLVASARRIGNRDFAHPIDLPRADELGQLAAEMNAMGHQLALALAAIEVETDARVRAVEQLRHADRLTTIGKLAAGVAHELGTPLSVVSGHAQMISEREVVGDAVIASARAIDRESARMSRMVRQLVDFARRKTPVGTVCDPTMVVHRCLALLAPLMERGNINCNINELKHSVQVNIDEDSLQQVLTNLIVNAIHAMPTGGSLDVTVSGYEARQKGTTGPDEAPCIRIDVRDTGTGIPAEVRPYIFEPFFTTKSPGEGTGLGLAVVEGIVSDHGGQITVQGSERGTTFSIFLREVAR